MYLSLCNKRTDSGELEELFFKQKEGKNKRQNSKNYTPVQSKSPIKRRIFFMYAKIQKNPTTISLLNWFLTRGGDFFLLINCGDFRCFVFFFLSQPLGCVLLKEAAITSHDEHSCSVGQRHNCMLFPTCRARVPLIL